MSWRHKLPLGALAVPAVFLALAPFSPEPHLVEKLRMLVGGELHRPLDWFDLFMHATPISGVAWLWWWRRRHPAPD